MKLGSCCTLSGAVWADRHRLLSSFDGRVPQTHACPSRFRGLVRKLRRTYRLGPPCYLAATLIALFQHWAAMAIYCALDLVGSDDTRFLNRSLRWCRASD